MAVRWVFGTVLSLAVLPLAAGAQTTAPSPSSPPPAARSTVPAEVQPGGPKRPPDERGPAADPLARNAAPTGRVAPTLPTPAAPGDARGVVPK